MTTVEPLCPARASNLSARRILCVLCVLCGAVLLLSAGGCTMRVIPPALLYDPVTVVLADYGYHSSVVLPREDGQSAEFAFGQWDWFARGEETSGNAVWLVLVPTTGALGTRVIPAETSLAGLTGLLPVRELQEIRVERSAAYALREHLQAQYDARIATEMEHPHARMRFVQTAEPFSIFRTCNHETADWLIRLGCRVDGLARSSQIEVLPPE
jgi:hypothetical protein